MASLRRLNPRHVTILLVTGRIVEIQQERSAFVLISLRFALFLLALVTVSLSMTLFVIAPEVSNMAKAIGWVTGTLIVIATIYFTLYLMMNYTQESRRLIIFSPVLSLIGVCVATPIIMALISADLPRDQLVAVAIEFFVGGLITAEVGMTTFVHLVRDPLVQRFEIEKRRSVLSSQASVRIGGKEFPIEGLCYLEAENQYIRVNMKRTNVLVAGQLTEVERQLDTYGVFRPHRSYLVFRGGIATVKGRDVRQPVIHTICGAEIPVARRRVLELEKWLDRMEDMSSQTPLRL